MSLGGWLGDDFPLPSWLADSDLAVDTARVIADKTTSIKVKRAGSASFTGEPNGQAQIVRLETIGSPGETRGENVTAANAAVLIVGYRGHPTIPDVDLKRSDRFYLASHDATFTVTAILVDTRDSLQAIAEAGQP